MTDGVNFSNLPALAPTQGPDSYRTETVREATARAASVRQDTSPEERDGLTRLNRILGQDRPLRRNVPRGFYLNIRV
jgi:predicted secreted protein